MQNPRDNIFITCAVTGNLTLPKQTPHLPITPEEIADACLGAAEAGAAIVHIHVREPGTGKPSMEIAYYQDVVARIRDRNKDVILNLTTGPGGRFVPSDEDPKVAGPGTTLIAPEKRVEHIALLTPEICTLDCGSLNFGNGAYIATADLLRDMAARIQKMGVKPEIEAFELGHIWLAKQLIAEGLIDSPPLFQICLGIPWGAEATTEAMLTMRNHLPADCNWAGFAIGRNQMGFVAQSMLLGGNVRVGLEDNIWLDKGVHATNGTLVARAKEIVERLGGRTLTPAEARIKLGLKKQR